MRTDLLELLICPACGAPLAPESAVAAADAEVWSGALHCTAAAEHHYPIIDRLPHLYIDDAHWQPKRAEADGWVTYHKQLGIYEPVENSVDLVIPYHPEQPWIDVAHSFDIALNLLQLTGAETVLDLGAGRAWAAKQFALRGCRVVALDIVPDPNIGLGRAYALMQHAGVHFHPILADAENIPLRSAAFDLVFCAAALHHTSDMPRLLTNAARVLRPGGRLCLIREPCIPIWDREERALAADAGDELALGINENRPDLPAYLDALRRSGLEPVHVLPGGGAHLSPAELRNWAAELGALWSMPSWRQPVLSAQRALRFLRLRSRAVRAGRLGRAARLPQAGAAAAAQAVLTWVGGELIVVARKPTHQL